MPGNPDSASTNPDGLAMAQGLGTSNDSDNLVPGVIWGQPGGTVGTVTLPQSHNKPLHATGGAEAPLDHNACFYQCCKYNTLLM